MRIYLATCMVTPQSISAQILGVRAEVKLAVLQGKTIPQGDEQREVEALERFLKDRWGDRAWFSRENGSFLFMDSDSAYECYDIFASRGSFLPIRIWLKRDG